MATPAAPASGARSGAGPEWGGFEENIQVIAPKALAASSPRAGSRPAVSWGLSLGAWKSAPFATLVLSFGSWCTRKAVGLVLT